MADGRKVGNGRGIKRRSTVDRLKVKSQTLVFQEVTGSLIHAVSLCHHHAWTTGEHFVGPAKSIFSRGASAASRHARQPAAAGKRCCPLVTQRLAAPQSGAGLSVCLQFRAIMIQVHPHVHRNDKVRPFFRNRQQTHCSSVLMLGFTITLSRGRPAVHSAWKHKPQRSNWSGDGAAAGCAVAS